MSKLTNKRLFYIGNLKAKEKMLYYAKKYELYLKDGISYNQLIMMLDYDYRLFLKTKENKNNSNDEFEYNELCNISTNIESNSDAICKMQALILARKNLY